MGDRGNIAIKQDASDPLIYLYTHWRGYKVKEVLAEALQRGQTRWDDPAYLTRIIFDTLVDGDTGTTGFGISLRVEDNEHPIPVVDCIKRAVNFEGKNIYFADWIEQYMPKPSVPKPDTWFGA